MNVTTSDEQLLRAFVDRGDQVAFRAIVDRHVQAVHAAARRQIRDSQLAEDVAQATFVMLARKADRIRDGAVLGGWLIATARLAAKTALRGETRRKRREQRAATMSLHESDQLGRNDDASAMVDRDDMLERVDAQLDEALARLSPADRTAVTLRYLQSRPLREVAEMMGTSEQAAAKRVTRAIAKLKKMFARRGIDLTPAALIAALERQAEIALPPGLADAAFAAATGTGGASSAAASIASDALGRASLRSAIAAAAGVALFIGTIAAGMLIYRPSIAPAVAVQHATSQAPLRVGVYMSHDTAIHLKDGKPRGWGDQVRILDELKPFPGLDIRPLIEPGTAEDPQQAQKLRQYFPNKGALSVANADALRRELDVILVSTVCEPRDEALAAIESAVRNGTGLVVRQCFGGHSERLGGYAHPQIRLLRGLSNADPDMLMGRSGQVTADVVASHPLLGKLSGQNGSKVTITVYGGYGRLADQSSGLIQVRDIELLRHIQHKDEPIKRQPGWAFFPLHVTQLDKGRIVSCNFAVTRVPQELDLATDGKFTVNALQWAAGRNVE